MSTLRSYRSEAEIFPCSILSAFLLKTYNKISPLALGMAEGSFDPISMSRLQKLLLAYYRILQTNRPLPHDLCWALNPLAELFLSPHTNTGVKLLSIRCYAIQSGMSELSREKLEKQVLGERAEVDCQIGYCEDVNGIRQEVDGWLLPLLEIKRVTDAKNSLITEPQDFYSVDEGDVGSYLASSDLWHVFKTIILLSQNLLMHPQPPHSKYSWHLISPITRAGDKITSHHDTRNYRCLTCTVELHFPPRPHLTYVYSLVREVASSFSPSIKPSPRIVQSNHYNSPS